MLKTRLQERVKEVETKEYCYYGDEVDKFEDREHVLYTTRNFERICMKSSASTKTYLLKVMLESNDSYAIPNENVCVWRQRGFILDLSSESTMHRPISEFYLLTKVSLCMFFYLHVHSCLQENVIKTVPHHLEFLQRKLGG